MIDRGAGGGANSLADQRHPNPRRTRNRKRPTAAHTAARASELAELRFLIITAGRRHIADRFGTNRRGTGRSATRYVFHMRRRCSVCSPGLHERNRREFPKQFHFRAE
ncbi:MAG: hypothetical protein D6744_04325 [Planctomycetota bacterium]|nr:MAG: hypothetical protein D6744_04325 [Planctomycetota bacterium]